MTAFMFTRRFRKSSLYRRGLLKLFLTFTIAIFLLDSLYWTHVSNEPKHHSQPRTPIYHGRIFIASIHWNNEKILKSHWSHAVVDLVKYLGPQNVFVAVLESGSWDDSKGALKDLDIQLGELDVPRSVVLENTTHKDELARAAPSDEPGWIKTTDGDAPRRIPYLAKLRNRVMDEMSKSMEAGAPPFDKIIWLNDVVFKTEDIVTLLSTNGGDYSAACALDFSKTPHYYDTFALRDISGAKTTTQIWPYFAPGASRQAMLSNKAVPVQSCWNGAVVMDAEPFYGKNPLRFRGISDSLANMHLEGSECCLIHADNALSSTKGVYVNPNVRVGYSETAYNAVNALSTWPPAYQRIQGIWNARWATIPTGFRRMTENMVVSQRLRQWKRQKRKEGLEEDEPGTFCLINEMQILTEIGWKHV